MAWFLLIIAGACEVIGVWGMKAFADRKKLRHIVIVIISFGVSLFFLTVSFNTIPTSTAYAVWTGLGATGSTVMGIIVYKDSKEWRRLLFIAMIIIGVIGLKIFS